MKCFLVITVLFNIWAYIAAHPSGGAVEIEKQRLIKFPDDAFQYQTIKQSDETRRILEEINKINVNLGYVKKQEQTQQQQMPTILNSEQYLYPRPAYHPAIHGGVVLPPSIRNLRYNRRPLNRSQYNYRANYSPFYQYDKQYENYYPNFYLKVPINQTPRNFLKNFSGDYELIEELIDNNNNDKTSNLIQNLPKKHKLNNMYKIQLVGNFEQFMNVIQENQNKMNKENGARNALPLIFLQGKIKSYDEVQNELNEKTENNLKRKTERQRVNNKVKEVEKPIKNNNKIISQQSQQLLTPTELSQQRFKFGFFNRPPQQPSEIIAATTAAPLLTVYEPQNLVKISNIKESDDYYSNEASSENSEANFKFLLAQFQKDKQDAQKEALKGGGIIIQRLKVRKGGIAIAGPGGVATAGSGGTAIVGPGGFALTHPKSLTIAGPGAKVIAYPETVNLGEAALKTNSQNIPEGGKIVATGPTVYYNPEIIYQTANIQTWPLYALPFPQLPVIHRLSQLESGGQLELQNQILLNSILQNSNQQQAALSNLQVKQSVQLPIDSQQTLQSQLESGGQLELQNQILLNSILQTQQQTALSNLQVEQPIGSQQKSQPQILFKYGQQQSLQYPGNIIPLSYAPLQFYQLPFSILPEQISTKTLLEKTSEKEPEPTTKRPNNEENITSRPGIPEKLIDTKTTNVKIEKSIVRDLQYLSAIQQPNKKFIIERIVSVPGTRHFQITTLENNNQLRAPAQLIQKSKTQKLNLQKSSEKLIAQPLQINNIEDTTVKVEVTGRTASDLPVADIPIGAYFVPYFGGVNLQTNQNNGQQASLILEPQAKAIAGNGGTAISAPISRAILKKGINTRVFFRPQSVAIAGAGGTAHAQADLILDYVNRRK